MWPWHISCRCQNLWANRVGGWTYLVNMISLFNTDQAGFMGTAMLCHAAPASVSWRRTVVSARMLAAAPITCDALSADGSTALPAPIRFPPRYSQPARSPDLLLNTGHADTASELLEAPILPVSSSDATHASPSNDVTARTKVFGVTAKPSSLTLEDTRNAQATEDSFQPVIQALSDGVKPPQESLRDFPEEARILFFSGIHSSSKMASCTGDITTQMAPLGICKL